MHDPTRMSTCPIPCLESSPTPSHMPKPNVRKKYSFQKQKVFVLENILLNFGKIYWTTIQGELLGNSLKQSWVASEMNCWTTLQGNSSEKSSLKFLSQPFSFFFHFLSCHALTPTILGCPGAYGMHYAISKQFMLIYFT